MCTAYIACVKTCKTWCMSDIHTSSFRAFLGCFSSFLKTEQKFTLFCFKQFQRNSISVKSQQNKRNKNKAAALEARRIAAACNARCECFAARGFYPRLPAKPKGLPQNTLQGTRDRFNMLLTVLKVFSFVIRLCPIQGYHLSFVIGAKRRQTDRQTPLLYS